MCVVTVHDPKFFGIVLLKQCWLSKWEPTSMFSHSAAELHQNNPFQVCFGERLSHICPTKSIIFITCIKSYDRNLIQILLMFFMQDNLKWPRFYTLLFIFFRPIWLLLPTCLPLESLYYLIIFCT